MDTSYIQNAAINTLKIRLILDLEYCIDSNNVTSVLNITDVTR